MPLSGAGGIRFIRRNGGWPIFDTGWLDWKPTSRLCFGSRRLWRKQHHLEANGYGSHEEWLSEWRAARSDEFFVLGSRDETAGCQLCVATVADDGRLTLRLRMPDCLANQHGKYLVIEGVRFAYGHEQVLAALHSNAEYGRMVPARQARGTHHEWRTGGAAPWTCGRGGYRRFGQLHQRLAGATGDLRQEHSPGGGSHRRRRGQRGCLRPGGQEAHRHREAGLPAEEGRLGGESPVTAGCCRPSATARSRRTSSPAATVRELKYIRSTRPQFDSRPGEVHGALRADGAPGSGPWCWPVACSAVPSASRAGGFVPSAMACRSPSPYP